MRNVDTLIHAAWVLPVAPEHQELADHSVAITDGRIVDIGPRAKLQTRYTAAQSYELDDHVLIPGLINAHTHTAMSLFRGMADDLPLMEWLQEHIWPAEGRVVGPEFVRDGAQLAMAEMMLGGTTCFNDMYFFPDQVGKAAVDAGMRAALGLILIDFPTVWAKDAADYIAKGLALHDEFRHQPLLSTTFAPHAPYTVSDEPLMRIRTLADELELPIHIHVHETAGEVAGAVEATGRRPLARLAALGLLSPRLMAVHMTQLEANEIELVADQGAHVVHCPESNLKLASGFCPVAELTSAGVNVALGTDGSASNNDLDMLSEMRTAAQLAKAVSNDAAVIPAASALRMATLNGAEALGLDHVVGSIEVGKAADLVAVNLSDLATQPVYSATSTLVYAASRHQVSDVWINGKSVVRGRELCTLDAQHLRARAREWRDRIATGANT